MIYWLPVDRCPRLAVLGDFRHAPSNVACHGFSFFWSASWLALACTLGAGCTSGTVVLVAPGRAEGEAATRLGTLMNEHMLLTESGKIVGFCLAFCFDCNTPLSLSCSTLPWSRRGHIDHVGQHTDQPMRVAVQVQVPMITKAPVGDANDLKIVPVQPFDVPVTIKALTAEFETVKEHLHGQQSSWRP